MSDAPAPVSGTSLPFTEAIDFLRAKLGTQLPSTTWTDTYGRVNSVGFAVAGAWKDALLSDLGAAVLDHLENGKTVQQFQPVFEAIAAKHQWAYKGKPAWRAAIILNTNIRSAYAAGKWQQIQRVKQDRPYIRYVAVLDARTRPAHRAWNGTILPVEDKWWQTHFPPNGWNCRCTVMSLSDRDLVRKGWKVDASPAGPGLVPTVVNDRTGEGLKAVPYGIDPSFEHNPGAVLEAPFVPQLADDLAQGFVAPIAQDAAARFLAARQSLAPPIAPEDLPPLPAPRAFDPARMLPADVSDTDAVNAFLAEFGVAPGGAAIHIDQAGGALGISGDLFRDASGFLKLDKGGRKPYLRVLADVLKDPDEIWVSLEVLKDGTVVVRRRALGLFTLDGQPAGGLAAFEWGSDKTWGGLTIFPPAATAAKPNPADYLDLRGRFGVRLYARGEG
jgi:SPP1 gp7 family putative phage head morphogenesis protein